MRSGGPSPGWRGSEIKGAKPRRRCGSYVVRIDARRGFINIVGSGMYNVYTLGVKTMSKAHRGGWYQWLVMPQAYGLPLRMRLRVGPNAARCPKSRKINLRVGIYQGTCGECLAVGPHGFHDGHSDYGIRVRASTEAADVASSSPPLVPSSDQQVRLSFRLLISTLTRG